MNIAKFVSSHPLTRSHKLRALGRVIKWQISSRLHSELTVPWIGNTRLAVRRGMAGATGNIYCGLHEFEDMAFVFHLLRPGDVFADIGANIGSYTILASGLCGAYTVAFEPDPLTFAALRRNVTLNSLDNLTRCEEYALGAQQGQVRFTVGLDSVNRVVLDSGGVTRTVPMQTLDRALSGVRPVLIKMDVEGFEGEVLKGATETLRSPDLKAIISEDRSPGVTEVLRDAGFHEHSYEPFSRRLSAGPGAGRQNSLFLRDIAMVQDRVSEATRIRVLDQWL